MAARNRRTTLNEKWKENIRTGMLIKRLHDCAEGSVELTSNQIKAAEILLRKSVPDLKAVELSGDLDIESEITIKKIEIELVGS